MILNGLAHLQAITLRLVIHVPFNLHNLTLYSATLTKSLDSSFCDPISFALTILRDLARLSICGREGTCG